MEEKELRHPPGFIMILKEVSIPSLGPDCSLDHCPQYLNTVHTHHSQPSTFTALAGIVHDDRMHLSLCVVESISSSIGAPSAPSFLTFSSSISPAGAISRISLHVSKSPRCCRISTTATQHSSLGPLPLLSPQLSDAPLDPARRVVGLVTPAVEHRQTVCHVLLLHSLLLSTKRQQSSSIQRSPVAPNSIPCHAISDSSHYCNA